MKYKIATTNKDGRMYLDEVYTCKSEAERHMQEINQEDGENYWCVVEVE